jgi:glutamate N-acetyltransferase/amino-acid N-acetyltransferase
MASRKASTRATPPAQDLAVPGFRFAGIHCGIKAKSRDLALAVCEVPATVAAVFTTSTVVGAPVEWCRERVKAGVARALVVNSGISNVAMGARGKRDNRAIATLVAKELGVPVNQVMTAATGVIGQPLPMPQLRRGVPAAAKKLSADGLAETAEAIRTTDTFAKTAVRRVRIGGKLVTVAGIAKGSGMIEPQMATMLAYVFTDADISAPHLRRLVKQTADVTFNRLSVDGETSTSDTFMAFASGVAGNATLRSAKSADAARFAKALLEVCESLVRDLAGDGEGATKLVTIDVKGAASPAQAETAARRIANSALVKTALFGRDPNWGRILQTLGAGRVTITEAKAQIHLCGVPVFAKGAATGPAARKRAYARMGEREISIEVDLAAGTASTRMWTCDFSYDYVRINAEYTT